jgi:ubiquinone/menaquinone biosynthesis C-methylase UbiE
VDGILREGDGDMRRGLSGFLSRAWDKVRTTSGLIEGRSASSPHAGGNDELAWLALFPKKDGFPCISRPQTFAHDETRYDEQYDNKPDMSCGNGLLTLLREMNADFEGSALEIGCGTGLLSLGLVNDQAFPAVVLTDPSPAFLKITLKKLESAMVNTERVHLAVLKAEEIDRLPGSEFSLIVLRSVLHHVPDMPTFINDAALSLRPAGILTFQEPCMEGYVLMGAMAQFIPLAVEKAGALLTDEQQKKVQLFVDTMRFYARRDVDKSAAEDKHLLRVDEVMKICSSAGLSAEFFPNTTYERYAAPPGKRPAGFSFYAFFHDYLKYCMSFDPELMALFDKHFRDYCGFPEGLSSAGNGPYMHGVFVCKKL